MSMTSYNNWDLLNIAFQIILIVNLSQNNNNRHIGMYADYMINGNNKNIFDKEEKDRFCPISGKRKMYTKSLEIIHGTSTLFDSNICLKQFSD